MFRVLLFGEDHAHRSFVEALVRRIGRDEGAGVSVITRSAVGGRPQLENAVRKFALRVSDGREMCGDVVIVATDANCEGHTAWRERITHVCGGLANVMGNDLIVVAPDPHIERWMLIDSHAFRKVFGKGCAEPDQKCERERYKDALMAAMQAAGVDPPLGGMEYSEDIVRNLDLGSVIGKDPSLGRAIKAIRSAFRRRAQG